MITLICNHKQMMPKDKIKLTGGWYGVKIIKKYANPDIKWSKILDHKCIINSISLSKTSKGKDKEVFIYHSFDETNEEKTKIEYGGRWYLTDSTVDQFEFDEAHKTMTYVHPEWEIDCYHSLETINDVPIVIKFTEKGWTKITEFYDM
jgi:hypothetical protein